VGATPLDQAQVVWIMNAGLSVFLLLDFAVRLWHQRWQFLIHRNGWMLLLEQSAAAVCGCPAADLDMAGRALVRRSDYRQMKNVVVRRRAQSTLLSAVLAAIIMLEVGALLILDAEGASAGQHQNRD
jgi:hypothetical protein